MLCACHVKLELMLFARLPITFVLRHRNHNSGECPWCSSASVASDLAVIVSRRALALGTGGRFGVASSMSKDQLHSTKVAIHAVCGGSCAFLCLISPQIGTIIALYCGVGVPLSPNERGMCSLCELQPVWDLISSRSNRIASAAHGPHIPKCVRCLQGLALVPSYHEAIAQRGGRKMVSYQPSVCSYARILPILVLYIH
ncbi:hypothetical protein K466DRAFT_26030 [Polyporus arcularius HHB13444]|uniref:Uncharacterized protein n=1 Tax=Polyporus arcularius HHB13444 TaxID=1314778 RepID=A0A5C3PMN9_9APHY|nr:hypothetical protein K466DRAFT_26030 [Polyporus arcularius HHB13444]